MCATTGRLADAGVRWPECGPSGPHHGQLRRRARGGCALQPPVRGSWRDRKRNTPHCDAPYGIRKRQSRSVGGPVKRHCPRPRRTPPWLSRGQKSRGSQNAARSPSRLAALPPSLFCSARNARTGIKSSCGQRAAVTLRGGGAGGAVGGDGGHAASLQS